MSPFVFRGTVVSSPNVIGDCGRRLQIDPVCRVPVTQLDDLEPVAGLGIAAANGGAVKSRRLGHICVGTNNCCLRQIRTPIPPHPTPSNAGVALKVERVSTQRVDAWQSRGPR